MNPEEKIALLEGRIKTLEGQLAEERKRCAGVAWAAKREAEQTNWPKSDRSSSGRGRAIKRARADVAEQIAKAIERGETWVIVSPRQR